MVDKRLLGPPRVRRKLSELAHRNLNFDIDDQGTVQLCAETGSPDRPDLAAKILPAEPPGMPAKGGSWHIARRLIQNYEFADPSIVCSRLL